MKNINKIILVLLAGCICISALSIINKKYTYQSSLDSKKSASQTFNDSFKHLQTTAFYVFNEQIRKNDSNKSVEQLTGYKTVSENLFGVWLIEAAVLKSDMYTGTTLDGTALENLYDPADYTGYELEYSEQFFRLGENIYENPKYEIEKETIHNFNNYGGKFKTPNIWDVLEEYEIELENQAPEPNRGNTLLTFIDISFEQEVSYNQYSFIPVGTQIVILNKDYMLVERWGKILLAHKVG